VAFNQMKDPVIYKMDACLEKSGGLLDDEIIGMDNSAISIAPEPPSKGILFVTAYCYKDELLLKKRFEWFDHIGFKSDRDIILISDYDVESDKDREIAQAHKKYFRDVYFQKIQEQSPNNWPFNVNQTFRNVVKILTGYYGKQIFKWSPYLAWFYFEPDVTFIKKDISDFLEASYKKGKKPFCGAFNSTKTEDNGTVRHLNGAAIYPTREFIMAGKEPYFLYSQEMMLATNTPWDVASLHNLYYCSSMPEGTYVQAFGTTNYKKSITEEEKYLTATQTLVDGTKKEINFNFTNQIMLHHGCKDGSLIDILIGKTIIPTVKESITVQTDPVSFQIKNDIEKKEEKFDTLTSKKRGRPKKFIPRIEKATDLSQFPNTKDLILVKRKRGRPAKVK
jgi:hypothetical protein